jgi:hypothetical protein
MMGVPAAGCRVSQQGDPYLSDIDVVGPEIGKECEHRIASLQSCLAGQRSARRGVMSNRDAHAPVPF